MSQLEAKNIVKELALKLKENKFDFSDIFLFGSHAKGKATKYSDIDVAVVSKKMSRNYEKNLDRLIKISFEMDDRIEIHAFAPDDFKEGYPPLAHEVKLTGIKIA